MANNKASALVVSLLILSIIILTALSFSLVSIRERNASIGESHSSLIFQTADTGVEDVMYDILKGGHTTINQLDNCRSDGTIKDSDSNPQYYVILQDIAGVKIDCHSIDLITSIASLKSVSNFSGNSRAIMAAVVFP